MHASLDPVVEQPVAFMPTGACHRSARMFTQRDSSSAVCGYSSLSIMFFARHSVISTCACGSIQVVTNVARFSRAFPSSSSSSRTTCAAVPGSVGSLGRECLGTGSCASRTYNGLMLNSAGSPDCLASVCNGTGAPQ
jgi:hypothetical protein